MKNPFARLWLLDHHHAAIIIPAVLLAGTSLLANPLLTVPLLLAYAAVIRLVLPNLGGGNIHRPDEIRFAIGTVASLIIITAMGTLSLLIMFAYVPVLSVLARQLKRSITTMRVLVTSPAH